MSPGLSYSCGGFMELVSSRETGSISSPNYPGNYPSLARCIWVFEAPKEYSVSVSISMVQGEGTTGTGCVDYLEVR